MEILLKKWNTLVWNELIGKNKVRGQRHLIN